MRFSVFFFFFPKLRVKINFLDLTRFVYSPNYVSPLSTAVRLMEIDSTEEAKVARWLCTSVSASKSKSRVPRGYGAHGDRGERGKRDGTSKFAHTTYAILQPTPMARQVISRSTVREDSYIPPGLINYISSRVKRFSFCYNSQLSYVAPRSVRPCVSIK